VKLKRRLVGDVMILDLSGNVTGGPDQKLFQNAIREVVEEGHKKILINMEDVPWVNSTGLGILMGGFATVSNAGGSLRFMNVGNRIQPLLLVTRLQLVFQTYDSEADALAGFENES